MMQQKIKQNKISTLAVTVCLVPLRGVTSQKCPSTSEEQE